MAKILRLPEVLARYGKRRSPVYADMSSGLFPRPVRLGARTVGWVEDEVEEVILARIAGRSDEAIRLIVEGLHAKRRGLANEQR